MCGLVGIAGDIDHETRSRIFKDFLDTCASRGRDSTGVIRVKKGGDYSFAKQLGSPAYLYDSRQWDRHIEGEAQALIGHCRSKTIGDVSIKNAHPFDFPDRRLIGVHNGTLRGYHQLDTYHHAKVDSEIMYGHMAENGVEDTFKNVEGAYACVWWDDQEGTLNFFRNNERPLWFTWSADFRTMYWASEIWMFGAIARKKKLWDGGDKKEIYHELPPHTLWSFRINAAAKGEEKVMSLRPVVEIKPEKKSYTPPHIQHGGSSRTSTPHGNFVNGRWVETSPGVMERKFEPPILPNQRGRVTSPFTMGRPAANEQKTPEKTVLDLDKLDLLESIQDGGTSSQLSNVEFLRRSVASSECKTESSSTPSSRKNTLSLPGKTSNIFPIRNNGESSQPCDTSPTSSRRLKDGVSFRAVAGVPYITWNATGQEFTEFDVMHNTGGACTFCKKALMDITEIAEFIDASNVLCTTCLEEPSQEMLYEVC